MQSFAAPPSLYPEELRLEQLYAFALLDFNSLPSMSLSPLEQFYASIGVGLGICALWNGLAMMMVCSLNKQLGLGMKHLRYFGSSLNTLVGLLSNSAYLVVLSKLLSVFECVYWEDMPPVVRSTVKVK